MVLGADALCFGHNGRANFQQCRRSSASVREERCAGCQRVFFICSGCDRGNRYCGSVCRAAARKSSVKAARKRHLASEEGRKDHRAHQRAYRARKRTSVSDQSSGKLADSQSCPSAAPPTRPAEEAADDGISNRGAQRNAAGDHGADEVGCAPLRGTCMCTTAACAGPQVLHFRRSLAQSGMRAWRPLSHSLRRRCSDIPDCARRVLQICSRSAATPEAIGAYAVM